MPCAGLWQRTRTDHARRQGSAEIGCRPLVYRIPKDAYPINVLDRIKTVPEVCSIYAATANPIEVVVAETGQGRGILGVIDGLKPRGIESPQDTEDRKSFLRKIGYKL